MTVAAPKRAAASETVENCILNRVRWMSILVMLRILEKIADRKRFAT